MPNGASCLATPGKKFHSHFAGKHPLTIATVPSLLKGACVAGGLYFVLSPLDVCAPRRDRGSCNGIEAENASA
jgi:hypothetical protein